MLMVVTTYGQHASDLSGYLVFHFLHPTNMLDDDAVSGYPEGHKIVSVFHERWNMSGCHAATFDQFL